MILYSIYFQNPVDTRRTAISPGALILSRDTPLIYFKNNLTDNFDTSIEQHNNQLRIQSGGNGATAVRFATSGVGVTVYNQLDTTNLSISGVSTFTGVINANGQVKVGTGGTAFTTLATGQAGIGTATPTTDFQVTAPRIG